MSEAATNPAAEDTSATGVAEPVTATTSDDDIDTTEFDRAPAPDEDDETPAGDGEGDEVTGKDKPVAEDDEEEVELADGRKVKAPKELALGYLRQSDYTQKTQALGADRRALETERATFASQREKSVAALPEEHAKIAIIDHQIATVKASLDQPVDQQGTTLRGIDWNHFRALATSNPEQFGQAYRDYRAAFDAAHDSIADLQRERGVAETDLKTKENQRLTTQREQAGAALQAAREETGKVLAREIKGWNQKEAEETARFAIEHGVMPNEIAEMTDPRVWVVLHKAKTLAAQVVQLQAALKQHQTAKNNQTAQAVTPAAPAKGNAQPNRVRDDLSTEEWMRRRNLQVAAKRKRA